MEERVTALENTVAALQEAREAEDATDDDDALQGAEEGRGGAGDGKKKKKEESGLFSKLSTVEETDTAIILFLTDPQKVQLRHRHHLT